MLEITALQNPVILEVPRAVDLGGQGRASKRTLALLILLIGLWIAYGWSLSQRDPVKRTTKRQV